MWYLDLKNNMSEKEVNGDSGEGAILVHENDEDKDLEGNLVSFFMIENQSNSQLPSCKQVMQR